MSSSSKAEDWIYTVRPGDTIWDVAGKHLVDFKLWRDLQRINQVSNPRVIQPGSRLRIPLAWLKVDAAPAEIVSANGSVSVVRSTSGSREPGSEGRSLIVGDGVETGDESGAVIGFADGSVVVVRANSLLMIDRLTMFGDRLMADSRVRLEEGGVDVRVNRASQPASRFEIFTRQAISAVRGTEFRTVTSSEDKTQRSEVTEGRVELSAEGSIVAVDQGFGTLTVEGEPPQPPRALLPAPNNVQVVLALDGTPLRLEIDAIEGAEAYSIEIARDDSFSPLLRGERSADAATALKPLAAGRYALRARGIDEDGIEGLNAALTFEVVAWPDPPNLIRTEIDDDMIQLEFEGGFPSGKIEVEIANDPDFEEVVERVATTNNQLVIDRLEEGQYFVRARSLTAFEDSGEFGDTSTFNIKDEVPWPSYLIPVLLAALAIIL